MVSYFQAARELDERWSFSLQFLPSEPALHRKIECVRAPQFARTEVDLFMHYAREIAATYELNLKILIEQYDILLTSRIIGIEYDDDLVVSPASTTRSSRRLLGR